MAAIKLDSFATQGKSLILAYDQGLEHGPTDFNIQNSDPNYILDIAEQGLYNGVVFHHGVAEKYYTATAWQIPLIVKLNGKTRLLAGDPISRQLCSVKRAIGLGARAVGYTIYPGSEHEEDMLVELGQIVEQAHDAGLLVIVWAYPRGRAIQSDLDIDVLAYSARVAAEMGADMIKIKYNGNREGFRWVVRCAGKARVLISGGDKQEPHALLETVADFMQAGASGMAVGRNIWQYERPLHLSKALRAIIVEGRSLADAKAILDE